MKVLSKHQIRMLHTALMARSGGIDGLRDEGLLDSAVNTPLQTFGGQALYPSLLGESGAAGLRPDSQPSFSGWQ